MNGRGEHVRHRVSLVLELWDDFADRPVSDPSIDITADGTVRPIRKEDGFYVFVNCPMPVHVKIRSRQYQDEEFDTRMQNGKAAILKKRLLPKRNYPIPDGTTCIEGTAFPGTKVGAVVKDTASALRLFADYDPVTDADHLELFDPSGKDLDGKFYYIEDASGEHSEVFRTVGYENPGRKLKIEPTLGHAYKKSGTKLYEYRYTRADQDGKFFLPLKVKNQGKKVICRIQADDAVFSQKIQTGIVNMVQAVGEAEKQK